MITTPHLLITDDDRDFRETLRSLFRPPRFQTLLAADGEEAVQIVRDSDIHLVLMDFQMPRLTGIEAVRLVKAQQAELPCILLSGAVTDKMIVQAEEVSMFSVLRKPIRVDELRQSVSRALQEVYGWTPEMP